MTIATGNAVLIYCERPSCDPKLRLLFDPNHVCVVLGKDDTRTRRAAFPSFRGRPPNAPFLFAAALLAKLLNSPSFRAISLRSTALTSNVFDLSSATSRR